LRSCGAYGGDKMPEKLDLFIIEVEQKQRDIKVRIETKDPIDALDLAHALIFSETFKQAPPTWKVLP